MSRSLDSSSAGNPASPPAKPTRDLSAPTLLLPCQEAAPSAACPAVHHGKCCSPFSLLAPCHLHRLLLGQAHANTSCFPPPSSCFLSFGRLYCLRRLTSHFLSVPVDPSVRCHPHQPLCRKALLRHQVEQKPGESDLETNNWKI